MKVVKILLGLLFFVLISCDSQTIQGEPEVDIHTLENNFPEWYDYFYFNITASNDFIPVDEGSNRISKDKYFKELLTGDFIPIKLKMPDSSLYYKLFRINKDSKIGSSISAQIRSISEVDYRNFKMEGKEFPEFEFRDINGVVYNSSGTKGKNLIIKCWFVNCVACIKEFPELNALVERNHQNDDMEFISLVLDPAADLEEFLERRSLNYSNVPEQSKLIREELGISEFPTHIVVGKDGKIEKVFKSAGAMIAYLNHQNYKRIKKPNEFAVPPPM
ncbi:TlpA family protein disulfide reductase [Robertkochia solimangrovi]|uniref:TlpA family protein disulfide reductase n=1 Tax=Robertkochia solimangrovi TaxID=2213046 RepID=UPI00118075CD|nr:TlpA disulfide reductase family protein [Robertkochia solimangrovi]TRZ45102.1 TlpA family protein disulfide reductase [Robertkochia solimangrovi]